MTRRLVVAVAVLGTLATIGVVVAARGDDRKAGGPLDGGPGAGWQTFAVLDEPFFFGQAVVTNHADTPAWLERVKLVRPTPGLRTTRIRAAGPRRRWELIAGGRTAEYFDREPQTDLHSLDDVPVPPFDTQQGRKGVEIVIDLDADRPGRYGFPALEVDYRVGGQRYRTTVKAAFTVCIDRGTIREVQRRWHERCPSVEAASE